ncbi:6817_t:CDS:2 [Entrophospora sp. SA101]|nr:6817_t:CDS:2 [Entrophospora sp. SA101]
MSTLSPNTSNNIYNNDSIFNTNPADTVAVSDFLNRVNLGSSHIKEIAGLGSIDYLKIDDNVVTPGAIPSRGIMDDLCYGTGTTYLAGLSFGGVWGLMEGFRGNMPNFKLRLNTILNSITRRGPFIGNSCGILAMGYNTINGIISSTRGRHDTINNVASGALVGVIFKSTAGIKAAATASLICAATAGTWTSAKTNRTSSIVRYEDDDNNLVASYIGSKISQSDVVKRKYCNSL